jgi:hypothetical protein
MRNALGRLRTELSAACRRMHGWPYARRQRRRRPRTAWADGAAGISSAMLADLMDPAMNKLVRRESPTQSLSLCLSHRWFSAPPGALPMHANVTGCALQVFADGAKVHGETEEVISVVNMTTLQASSAAHLTWLQYTSSPASDLPAISLTCTAPLL